jgi:hypothetical protein
MGLRKPPLVFTEQGVAMLSSDLNSDRAIAVNIQVIRVFTRMRELLWRAIERRKMIFKREIGSDLSKGREIVLNKIVQ